MSFITISRQTGSLGHEITGLVAKILGLPIIDRDLVMREWLPEVANKHELHMLAESPAFFLNSSQADISFAEYIEKRLKDSILEQPAIILGLGGQLVFAGHAQALHVKILASHDVRINRIMQTYSLEEKDAERFLDLTDRKHKKYITTLFDQDWSDPTLYHMVLNTDFLSIEESAAIICHAASNRPTLSPAPDETSLVEDRPSVVFKHPSEEEFARILDMHEIEWLYEPRTFPIKWDAEGNITLAFAPDFYLPRFDTYIELTTMNQKYVSEKKKKVQLLKKLYPGTNVSIVFKKDFRTLVSRFGLREENEE